MYRRVAAAVVGLLALLSFAVMASSANAVLLTGSASPTGTYTFTSRGVTNLIPLSTPSQTLTCQQSIISGSAGAGGVVLDSAWQRDVQHLHQHAPRHVQSCSERCAERSGHDRHRDEPDRPQGDGPR